MATAQQEQHADNIRTDYEIVALNAKIEALSKMVASLQSDRDKALLWGVLALGSAVMGMGMWIFNFVLMKKP